MFTGVYSCVNRPNPELDASISQAQYMANSAAWSASIQKQGPNILVKNTDSTVGGAISKEKVAALMAQIPTGGFLTYRFYTDPTSGKVSVMFRAVQSATATPLIYANDKFCPIMCD
jgi:hypothetical protein